MKSFFCFVRRKTFVPFVVMFGILLFAQCRRAETFQVKEDVPAEPNYSDSSQWYTTDRKGRADVFYIVSTETGDYTLSGKTYHHADTYNDSVRTPLYGEMLGVDTLISGKLNYFSPYYRQCSLQSYENDSIAEARMKVAISDVKKAFNYYLEHFNNGRPFVLAGFSQGASIALELMKDFNDATFDRMIAAYIIGTSITKERMEACARIVPAQGANDLGVTICYNSVADKSAEIPGISKGNVVAINPANWRTDEEPATFDTELSPLLPVSEQKKATITVNLDKESKLLFVKGFTADDYKLPLIGKEGNYHTREIWLYRKQLQENIGVRTEHYFKR
ncbi:MAG: DUF3089 domain-containing protein [Prevotella sp.]|nr:DUF3089 domain-containing protein [Prevotella sp.]